MKKLALPMIAIIILSLFVACNTEPGEITYTGDYMENLTSGYNNVSGSGTPSGGNLSDSTGSTTMLIPLTTSADATVPTVETTEVTVLPTMDYTPLEVDTTLPTVVTSYVSPVDTTSPVNTVPPTTDPATTNPPSTTNHNNNSTTNSPTNEQKSARYVSISPTDTVIGFMGNDKMLLSIPADGFKGSITAKSGNATVNINGVAHKVKYNVSSTLSPDNEVQITLNVSELTFADEDSVSVSMQKGAIVSSENYQNNSFTSISTSY